MKGDFSRITFDHRKHFSRVLLQQGRVTLDADPNEQSAILLHYMRTLARDLIGPCGGPADHLGFVPTMSADTSAPPKVNISAGRYYVDGILCECHGCDYASQPDYPLKSGSDGQGSDVVLAKLNAPNDNTQPLWLYLDVWERHITWIEDESIREPALNGTDTCTRAKVVWQIKALAVNAIIDALTKKQAAINQKIPNATGADQVRLEAKRDRLATEIAQLTTFESGQADGNPCPAPLDGLDGLCDACMTARLDPGQQIKDPCLISPDARYRGVENQLYRVEIHEGGTVGTATFKWSIDNGSVATKWLETQGSDLIVTNIRGFETGNWVELSDDSNDLLGQAGVLVKLVNVSPGRLTIDSGSGAPTLPDVTKLVHPKVRRWDQTENDDIELTHGAVGIVEATSTEPNWIDLKDGVQVQFAAGGEYRSGDYWLIPARVATGTIEWPHTIDAGGNVKWKPRRPDGIEHHYAPIGFLSWLASNEFKVVSCNCTLDSINSCPTSVARRDSSPRVPQVGGATPRAPVKRPARPRRGGPT